jgi:2-polyprenyl-3-methyl-5-hydroxy-6-metoxy-1,4-benzoquinol methylase
MPIRLDPEGNEPAALFDFAGSFAGQRVLEIGCGDGRLTWLYADQAAHIVALDPNADDIALAIQNCPPHLRERVEFRTSTIQEYESPERFDLALLSWSL